MTTKTIQETIPSDIDLLSLFNQAKKDVITHSDEFRRIFGIQLKCFYGEGAFDMALLGFNLPKLDLMLSQLDPEYDSENCMYKGLPNYSVKMYIQEKYGNRAAELIEILLH